MLRRRWRAAVLVAAIAGALLPVGVAAHPYLVSADPAAGATVPVSPAHITIFYTEELDGPYDALGVFGTLGDAPELEHRLHQLHREDTVLRPLDPDERAQAQGRAVAGDVIVIAA